MKREAHGLNVMNRMSLQEYRDWLKGETWSPAEQKEIAKRAKGKQPATFNKIGCLDPPKFGKQTVAKPRRKFGNHPTVYDSPLVGEMKYPSEGQAEHAKELDLLWRAGEILYWLPEMPIRLKGYTAARQHVMRIDFLICWKDGRVTWRDYKRVMTEAWTLKRDLVREQYGIEIEIV